MNPPRGVALLDRIVRREQPEGLCVYKDLMHIDNILGSGRPQSTFYPLRHCEPCTGHHYSCNYYSPIRRNIKW